MAYQGYLAETSVGLHPGDRLSQILNLVGDGHFLQLAAALTMTVQVDAQ